MSSATTQSLRVGLKKGERALRCTSTHPAIFLTQHPFCRSLTHQATRWRSAPLTSSAPPAERGCVVACLPRRRDGCVSFSAIANPSLSVPSLCTDPQQARQGGARADSRGGRQRTLREAHLGYHQGGFPLRAGPVLDGHLHPRDTGWLTIWCLDRAAYRRIEQCIDG